MATISPTSASAVVLVPIRGFTTGKSRLHALGADRANLVVKWSERVIAACSGFEIHVVTSDPEVGEWARAHGCAVAEDPGTGLNAALSSSRAAAVARGAASVAVVFADLAFVTAADIAELMATPGRIAPDRHGTGTNGLHVAAGSHLRYRFGPGSFALHLREDRRLVVVRTRGLGHDVDEPGDLVP